MEALNNQKQMLLDIKTRDQEIEYLRTVIETYDKSRENNNNKHTVCSVDKDSCILELKENLELKETQNLYLQSQIITLKERLSIKDLEITNLQTQISELKKNI